MANIYDVSKAAGVSIATVSRVLNGSTKVTEKTRQQVLRAVSELDFQPNAYARSLGQKNTQTIALVVPDLSNPFFPELARGVEDAASEAGYNLILCNSDNSLPREMSYCAMMRKRRVDGAIFITSGKTASHISDLDKTGVPVVLVDREPGDLPLDAVVSDNCEGGRIAAQHLLALGHVRIGIITGQLDTTTGSDRFRGFRETLQAQDAYRPEYVAEGTYDLESGYKGMQRLWDLPEQPTAILAGNDMMAIGAMQFLASKGVDVPGEVSLVGYDDLTLASITTPRLTTVAQPKYQMGLSAAEVLLRRLEDGGGHPRRVVLQPQLIVRGSTVKATATKRSRV